MPSEAERYALQRYSFGDPANGETRVGDGQTYCSNCDQIIRRGSLIFWSCSMEQECDPYCRRCAVQTAKTELMMDADPAMMEAHSDD